MSRWRYLRWWLGALLVCVLSFLSLWLPELFEGDGAVGCAGYGPLPSRLADLWSDLHETWLRLRQTWADTYMSGLVLNGLPSLSVLLSGLVSAWAGRRAGTVVGVVAVLVVGVVALDWVFYAFSYFLLLGCAGWEGRVPWMLWRLLQVFGYGSAVVLLVVGIRARRERGPGTYAGTPE
ncbi:hypothetical protein [Nonomuraea sp. SYSU D8015]|uniref:hypothetical protein n=1 Tax=Nonomuraea sp. SYSU D8015 TaxID=2593644 RepID=UPI0016601BE5|nr:hypothetical protein [Nonomuraea sp. SYSU D8015]